MSKVYETLKKKNDTSVEVYPNIERTNIPDGAINTDKIEDGSITTGKIVDGSITDGKLASNSVGHNNIKDYSIFPSKIYDGAVTEDKIGTDAVTTSKIKDGAVTLDKIAENTLIRYLLKVHSSISNFDFIIDFNSKYNVNDLSSILDELFRQCGENFACATVFEHNRSSFHSMYGYFYEDSGTIQFIDDLDEEVNVTVSDMSIAVLRKTSYF